MKRLTVLDKYSDGFSVEIRHPHHIVRWWFIGFALSANGLIVWLILKGLL